MGIFIGQSLSGILCDAFGFARAAYLVSGSNAILLLLLGSYGLSTMIRYGEILQWNNLN
jgi:hypothetical protein